MYCYYIKSRLLTLYVNLCTFKTTLLTYYTLLFYGRYHYVYKIIVCTYRVYVSIKLSACIKISGSPYHHNLLSQVVFTLGYVLYNPCNFYCFVIIPGTSITRKGKVAHTAGDLLGGGLHNPREHICRFNVKVVHTALCVLGGASVNDIICV